MADREKLIELIRQFYMNNFIHSYQRLADHLIANGVTFATDNNVGDKDYCPNCYGATYTEHLFFVENPNGRTRYTKFKFCPTCGRKIPEAPKGE